MTTRELENIILSEDTVALYCHTNPDGDSVGSMLGLYFALSKLGKDVRAYCDTVLPARLRYFKGSEVISLPDKRVAPLAISVDCASIDRLGLAKKSYLSAKTRIALDHHGTFTSFGQYNLCDPSATACAQVVYKLLKQMGLIDKDVAEALFGGIITDSGCFKYSNVSVETHEIACELMKCGIDASRIIYDVFSSTDMNRFELKNRILGKTKFFSNNRIALIVFESKDFEETGTDQSDTEGIVSELMDIRDVMLGISVAEVGDRSFKISLRSKDPVNCASIATTFGGGGHVNAAGCRLSGFKEDVIDKLLRISETYVE